MISVVFDPDARLEFLSAVQYYEDCQSGLGKRFSLAVEFAVNQITEAPLRYRTIKAPFRRYLLQKFPFGIIYSIEPKPYQDYCCCSYKTKAWVLVRKNVTFKTVARNSVQGKSDFLQIILYYSESRLREYIPVRPVIGFGNFSFLSKASFRSFFLFFQ